MRAATLLIVALISSPILAADARPHEVVGSEIGGSPKQYHDDFDWYNKGPLEFLDLLREAYRPGERLPFYSVLGEHRGWVRESDVPRMLEMATSTEPCLAVVSAHSSFLPGGPSTVGHEALYIVAGFRAGEYPPELVSTQWSGDLEEFRRWWKRRSSRSQATP